jgi:hypothetical protein
MLRRSVHVPESWPWAPMKAVPDNLPVQLTSFIGREPEWVAVAQLIAANG